MSQSFLLSAHNHSILVITSQSKLLKSGLERKSPWSFIGSLIMMLKRVATKVITFLWPVWELCQCSFLYKSHYHSDYRVTLMPQMINFLCLIPSKRHGLGSFYWHIQLLQHQFKGVCMEIPCDFTLFFKIGCIKSELSSLCTWSLRGSVGSQSCILCVRNHYCLRKSTWCKWVRGAKKKRNCRKPLINLA